MLFAQTAPRGNGKISGTVLDSANLKPVEFATVALMGASDKPVDGAVCDDKGKFTISKVADGSYRVVISFIGYKSKVIPVTISASRHDVELGAVRIGSEAEVLKEVTVQGQKVMIEERVDRTIYNAENDMTTKGGDATDVLKRVPMLSVDMDGNVSLRGNGNIQVLINNKPSTIVASSIADALKQIPADQIKTVEVITSPSAKYDAEGSAGIINIITKKNTLEGLTLNLDAGVGYRGSNLGLNGNYRRGKMGFSLGGFGRANYNVNGSFDNEQTTNGTTKTSQRADTRNSGLFGNYTLGWDYDINAKNTLAASVRFGVRNNNTYQDDLYTATFINSTPQNSTTSDVTSKNKSNNVDANLTYTHLYDKPQRELAVQGMFSRNNQNTNFQNIVTAYEVAMNGSAKTQNLNDSYNEEMTLQADYQTPIGTNQMLELGAKDIIRKVYSDFQSFRAATTDGAYEEVTSASLSNNLNYKQNVLAGYLSYTLNLKNGYAFKAGSRYEYTTISAYTKTESDINIPSYGVLVPSVNVSKKLKNGNTLKASYNRRIQRPSIRFLNPNIQPSNNLNVTVGNPQLNPEYTNNYELSYSTLIKGISLNFSGFVRNTNNAIQSVRDIIGVNPNDPDTIRTTYRNIGQEDAYGSSIFANINLGKLSLNGGGDVYYAVLNNNVPDQLYRASNEGWVVSGRLFGSYNLNKGWALQFFSFFRGRQVQLQGYQGGFRMYSLGVRKEFNDKRGSIGLGAENFVTPSMRIKGETISPVVTQRSTTVLNNMSFRINFSYRIGKMSMDQRPSRRRSINNDDLKDGGGDNGGGGMGDSGSQQSGGRSGNFSMGGATGGANRGGNTKLAGPPAQPADSTVAPAQVAGKWNYIVESPQGAIKGELNITKNGDQYTGTVNSNMMRQPATLTKVSVSGNNLYFAYTVSFGGNEVTIEVNATVKDDKTFDGNMNIGTFRTTPIKGEKVQ